eukprot:3933608-Rhodomonas_salina.1
MHRLCAFSLRRFQTLTSGAVPTPRRARCPRRPTAPEWPHASGLPGPDPPSLMHESVCVGAHPRSHNDFFFFFGGGVGFASIFTRVACACACAVTLGVLGSDVGAAQAAGPRP